jgi:RNA polymerase sigma-70 factor (ECF subfamily)
MWHGPSSRHSACMRTSALRTIPRAPSQSRAGGRTLDPPDPDIVPNGIDSDEVTDTTLVQQLVAGSAEALASLYDRYASEVFAAVVRMNGDRSTASEIVQETFLALWNRAELFDASRGSMRAWLLRIARNRAVDHHRALRRRHPAVVFSAFERDAEDDSSIAERVAAVGRPLAMATREDDPEHALMAQETRASIAGALASLSALERSVIVLAYDEGLSHSEIAARLGWPIGTVKTRTRRALRLLRARLERPLGTVEASGTGAPPATTQRAPSLAASCACRA